MQLCNIVERESDETDFQSKRTALNVECLRKVFEICSQNFANAFIKYLGARLHRPVLSSCQM
jgi:hypothetical protein